MHGLEAEIGAVILEPQAGVAPITQAPTGLDFNVYLIDNPTILTVLRQAGQRGVPIHVLLAPNPMTKPPPCPQNTRCWPRFRIAPSAMRRRAWTRPMLLTMPSVGG